MKINNIYDGLSDSEKAGLLFNAKMIGDSDSSKALIDSCPTKSYSIVGDEMLSKYEGLHHAVLAWGLMYWQAQANMASAMFLSQRYTRYKIARATEGWTQPEKGDWAPDHEKWDETRLNVEIEKARTIERNRETKLIALGLLMNWLETHHGVNAAVALASLGALDYSGDAASIELSDEVQECFSELKQIFELNILGEAN